MSRINQTYNWGKKLANEDPDLYRQLSEVYARLSRAINTKPDKTVSPNPQVQGSTASNPPSNSDFNKQFDIGDVYVRSDTDTAWIMTSRTTPESVTWTQIT